MSDENQSIKEEIYKCSKCGLCQSVCPLYLTVKNEMYLARGRYIVLNNFFNNNKKLSSKFIKDLDICLNCNECTNFCPSNIDAAKIFTEIKHNFNYKFGILPFSFLYFFDLFLHKIKKYFVKDEIYKILIKRQKFNVQKEKGNVVYFQGCFNKYINCSDKNASLNLIDKLNLNVTSVNSYCCGLPFLSDGDLDNFNKNAQKIIKTIPSDTLYIVCSCDSCYSTLKKAFQNTSLLTKLLRLEDLLKLNNFKVPAEQNVVFHKTLGRKEEYYLPIEVQKINKKGSCSLMENYFLLKYSKLAKKLIDTVFYKKEDIDNKTIITTCQLSKWGIKTGIKKIKSSAKVLSYSEYIELVSNQFKGNLRQNATLD